jgi:hypothetical protein
MPVADCAERCCATVWISKALTTMATPSSSCAAGGAPSAALISTADTGTTLRNAVPVTTPSVRTPKLNARMASTEGMAAMYSRACHDTAMPAMDGAGAH